MKARICPETLARSTPTFRTNSRPRDYRKVTFSVSPHFTARCPLAPVATNRVYGTVNDDDTVTSGPRGLRLTGIMVSGDWFARSLMRGAGEESGMFSRVIDADDGYTALAETWQCVDDGHAPDVIVIDLQAVGASAARLVTELRASSETQRTFVAVVGMPETEAPVTIRHVDFCTSHGVLSSELADTIMEIAMRAVATPQSRW